MKRLAILGSTGSIGRNSLKAAKHLGLSVTALAAHSNVSLLREQILEFQPACAALYDPGAAKELQKIFPNLTILSGKEGIEQVAAHDEVDFVLSAISGTLGLGPTLAAIEAGKTVGLANKEALVSGGSLVMERAREKGVAIIPVDSEHSAIFQCLQGIAKPRRLILTASGGPFRDFSMDALQKVGPEDALKHPNWSMGQKVTIDSSTMMNKGLEVIEAFWLFDMPLAQIEVVIHPQSIIHSMVEFFDGSILSQMGEPDMIIPIQYALTWPKREPGLLPPFDFSKERTLAFYPPDLTKFRCLSLAYAAIGEGGSMPCFMNGANEVLVERFLRGEIGWLEISQKLERLMEGHTLQKLTTLEEIEEVDRAAREKAERM